MKCGLVFFPAFMVHRYSYDISAKNDLLYYKGVTFCLSMIESHFKIYPAKLS